MYSSICTMYYSNDKNKAWSMRLRSFSTISKPLALFHETRLERQVRVHSWRVFMEQASITINQAPMKKSYLLGVGKEQMGGWLELKLWVVVSPQGKNTSQSKLSFCNPLTTITQCGDIRCVTKLLNLSVFISSTRKCLEQYSPQITEINVNYSESEGHWVNIKGVAYCSHQPTGSKAQTLTSFLFTLVLQLQPSFL